MTAGRWMRPLAMAAAGGVLLAEGRAYVPIAYDNAPYVFKWERSPIRFQVKLSTARSLTDGHSQVSSVEAAMAAWNAHLGTVQFAPQTATGTVGYGNGVNEVAMDTTINGDAFPAGVLAVTLNQGGSNAIAESDVIFNSALKWDSYRSFLREGTMDIQRVAIHEFGHVLGLDHPDEGGQRVAAIMNSRVSYVDGLMPDDIQGGQMLYGAPGFKPANDLFASASALAPPSGNGFTVTGTNIAAQRENGEPNHAGSTGGRTVWWKWTAPGTTDATLTTLGSNFDTVLAVYTGAHVGALTGIAANDDVTSGVIRTSAVSFQAIAGVTYFIAVDGWGDSGRSATGYSGSITLNLSYAPLPAAPSFTEQPAAQDVPAGAMVYFRAFATGRPEPSYRWQQRTAAGAWAEIAPANAFGGVDSSELRVHTIYAMNGDQFRCVATNALGSAFSEPATLQVRPVPLPVITRQPADGVAFGELGYQLWVEATGAWSYQWYRDGLVVPGAVYAAYPAHGSGMYHATVTNPGGSVSSQLVRVIAKPMTGVVAVRAADRRTMFLRADGSRWRTGLVYPHGGMIGAPQPFYADPDEVNTPVAVLGESHELAVRPDGTLWVSGDNQHGQLGFGDTQGRYASTYLESGVIAAAAGTYASYFIKRDGSLWGIGDNSLGQLGAGAASDFYTPVRIAGGVIAIAAYHQHALFIKADGSLWAMGANAFGQLGDGSKIDRSVPVRIAENVASMAVGRTSSAFVKHDGTAWAMGRNAAGELGDGTKLDRPAPVKVMSDALMASVGFDHSLWLKTDGTLWIAGNVAGQFEQPLDTFRTAPLEVAEGVLTMAAGTGNSLFVRGGGSLWGTGDSDEGKLGLGWVPLGHGNVAPSPVQVAEGPVTSPVAPQGLHTFVDENGRVYLRWRVAGDATRYEVWRGATSAIGAATRIAANVANALYSDPTAAAGVNFYWVRAINPAGAGPFSGPVESGGAAIAGLPPADAPAAVGEAVTLAVGSVPGATYQWRRNGASISGATSASLALSNLQPGSAGLYDSVMTHSAGTTLSSLAIVGLATTEKVVGGGTEIGANIVHPNRNVYDQVLLEGTAATITADPGQIVRVSFVDLSDDIVQVEFSGAGTLTLMLDAATGPAPAVNYRQPSVAYMKGHASIVVSGADETTHLSVFSVGRITAVNQTLFRDDVIYDGMADIGFIAIRSVDGRFGGLRTANGSYFQTRGVTGVYAPGVQFQGPVYVGDIRASDDAVPMLLIGGAQEVKIAGGDLEQANGASVQVGGFTALQLSAGTDSHGTPKPALPLRADLQPGNIDLIDDSAPH